MKPQEPLFPQRPPSHSISVHQGFGGPFARVVCRCTGFQSESTGEKARKVYQEDQYEPIGSLFRSMDGFNVSIEDL